jgi:hypothetical protein
MKNIIKTILYLLILGIVLTSCKDKYDSFTDTDKSFFSYEIGDSIRFIHNKTNDTITFKVISSLLGVEQNSITKKKTHEYKSYDLKSKDFGLTLSFEKNSPKNDRVFDIKISLVGDTSQSFYVSSALSRNNNELQHDVVIGGDNYPELFRFQSKYTNSNDYMDNKFVWYSKEDGIVQLNDPDNNETYTLIK